MIRNMICSFRRIHKPFRKDFMEIQWNMKASRQFASDFSGKYYEDRYGVMEKRLKEIPVLYLLEKEENVIHQDICYGNDERLEEVFERCSQVFNYNVRDDKIILPAVLFKAYCTYGFDKDDVNWNQWKSEGWRSAIILAWCCQLLKVAWLILDDVLDQSDLRRGQPCWYKKVDIGLSAINDSVLLQYGFYQLIEKYLARSNCYTHVLEEFLKINLETAYGQCMDMMFQPMNLKTGLEYFTFERYCTIAEYKTGNILFCLPVHLAMHLVGGYSVKEFETVRNICFKLGLYYQSQDDFLEVFGKPERTVSIGNDIRDGKCTWCSVKFLEEASEPMKKTFFKNYGVDNISAISKVVDLYQNANLVEKFAEFEKGLFEEIHGLTESMNSIKGYLFLDLLSQTQNREK